MPFFLPRPAARASAGDAESGWHRAVTVCGAGRGQGVQGAASLGGVIAGGGAAPALLGRGVCTPRCCQVFRVGVGETSSVPTVHSHRCGAPWGPSGGRWARSCPPAPPGWGCSPCRPCEQESKGRATAGGLERFVAHGDLITVLSVKRTLSGIAIKSSTCSNYFSSKKTCSYYCPAGADEYYYPVMLQQVLYLSLNL